MKKNPLILIVSDLHCGSTVGLMPKSMQTYEGQTIQPSTFQSWLLDNWEHCSKTFERYAAGRQYWLLIVGDCTEGIHHGGKQVISSNVGDHINAALAMLSPIATKAKAVFLAKGTECHVRDDEEVIGKELKAIKCPDTGHYTWDSVNLEVGPHLIQARHHMPTTGRVYLEGGALSINLGNTQLSYARHKQRVPDIVISGHRHRYGVYYDDESMGIACHAWQGLTRHGHKVVPGSLPKVGFGVLDWVRGVDELPYAFTIRKPLPKQLEASHKWR